MSPPTPVVRPTVDRFQAARILDVHVGTIDRYLRDGVLPRIKIGPKLVRIPVDALDAMLGSDQ